MKRDTAKWVRKAEDDWDAARSLGNRKAPLRDAACFHCRQAAEKYLKALLKEIGLPVPKIHYLDQRLIALQSHHPTLPSLRRGLLFLSVFAVDTRNPGKNASKRQAVAALRRSRTRAGL